MRRKLLATAEARDAARELRPLVTETRRVIADLAIRGVQRLDSLSADNPHHTGMPASHRPDSRFFQPWIIERRVSPKINADRTVRGYPDLTVVGASTGYHVRKHNFRHLPSLARPGRLASLELPFTKTPTELTIDFTSNSERIASRGFMAEFSPSIATNGTVVDPSNSHNLKPSPSSPSGHFETGEEVTGAYFKVFPQELAIAGLVAHGLHAYDIELGASDARSLFNEWRALRGDLPVVSEAFWTRSESNYLSRHQPTND